MELKQQGSRLGLAIVQRFAEVIQGGLLITQPAGPTGLVTELSAPLLP
jgi:hypothetical protein